MDPRGAGGAGGRRGGGEVAEGEEDSRSFGLV